MKKLMSLGLTLVVVVSMLLGMLPYGVPALAQGGGSWSPMTSGSTAYLRGVWGSSNNNVFAVDGTILHYDGNNWSSQTLGDYQLYGVWGSSANDIYAVGSENRILHSNDGNTWTSVPGFTGGAGPWYYDVWGTSASDVFVVGASGTIWHYNGTWTPMNSNTINQLEGVWGSSGSDVFAVGGLNYSGTILHYNGDAWSPMVSDYSMGFHDVWGSASNDVFAVGPQGTILHYDGNAWSS